jgi:hypothetical protein
MIGASHVVLWGRREMSAGFWWRNLKAKDRSEKLGAEDRNNIKIGIK